MWTTITFILIFTEGAGIGTAFVSCDPGDTALNGSYKILNPDILDLIIDKAIYTTTQKGWVVQASGNKFWRNLCDCSDC
jgi:hypothetical protein